MYYNMILPRYTANHISMCPLLELDFATLE